jgi:hypothetical protein
VTRHHLAAAWLDDPVTMRMLLALEVKGLYCATLEPNELTHVDVKTDERFWPLVRE